MSFQMKFLIRDDYLLTTVLGCMRYSSSLDLHKGTILKQVCISFDQKPFLKSAFHRSTKLLICIQEKKLQSILSKKINRKTVTHVNIVKGVKLKAVHLVPGGNIICEFLVHFRGKHHGMSPETIMHTMFHCILHSLR